MAVTTTWTDPSTGGAIDLNTGQVLTEVIWDAVLSNLKNIGGTSGLGTWVAFTPGLQQAVDLTATVVYARYCILGKTAVVQVNLAVTLVAGGTPTNAILISGIPAAIAPRQYGATVGSQVPCGSAFYYDSGTGYYVLVPVAYSATQIGFWRDAGTALFGGSITAVNLDDLIANLVYEIA